MELTKYHYTIKEVADMYDVSTPTLRHWERQFKQLVPDRNSKGRRYYTQEQVRVVDKIYHLINSEGMTIEGAKNRLSMKGDEVERALNVLGRLKTVRLRLVKIIQEMQ